MIAPDSDHYLPFPFLEIADPMLAEEAVPRAYHSACTVGAKAPLWRGVGVGVIGCGVIRVAIFHL